MTFKGYEILRLGKPLARNVVTQLFGDDNACILKDGTGNIISVNQTTGLCDTGYTSVYKYSGLKGHNGTDFGANTGTPIFACTDGTVCEIETEPSRGLGIGIVTDEKMHWMFKDDAIYYAKTRYWHLKTIGVSMGQKVKKGQIIGEADNTGWSTGSHLHLELKPVLYDKNGKMYNVFQDNGYFGAKNPINFMEDFKGQDLLDLQARIRGAIYWFLKKLANKI